MALLNRVLTQAVPGDAISSDSSSTGGLIIRAGLFMIFLLLFVVGCGYAWRKIPALRAFIPEFKPGESSLEARMAEKKRQQEIDEVALAEALPGGLGSAPRIAGPDLSKRPGGGARNPQFNLVPVQRPEVEALPLASELVSSDKRIEAALADGTPGSVVHAASDLDGSYHHAPIMIVSREEEIDQS